MSFFRKIFGLEKKEEVNENEVVEQVEGSESDELLEDNTESDARKDSGEQVETETNEQNNEDEQCDEETANDVEFEIHENGHIECVELVHEEEAKVVEEKKTISEIIEDVEELADKKEEAYANIVEIGRSEVIEEVVESSEEEVEDDSQKALKETIEEVLDEIIEDELDETVSEIIDEVIEEKIEEIREKLNEVDKETEEEIEVNEDVIYPQEELDTEAQEEEKISFFAKLKQGVKKTRDSIFDNLNAVFNMFTVVDEELFEELEEALILADMGVDTSLQIINSLRQTVKRKGITEVSEVKHVLIDIISEILEKDETEFKVPAPTVLLVIGVNGVGKTTTIGKLAHKYISEGKSVTVAAADTFRAAAIEQLEVWANRTGANFIRKEEGSDPASVVFDACKSAKAKNADLLIIDTAGRLHNKKNLMNELAKIHKIIEREYGDAHKEVLLVLDSTTGQNAMQQAKLFNESADITGLVLTKLDGTAKGGVIVSIKNELNVPVRFVGLGEKIDDLEEFNSKNFAKALFE